MSTFTDSNVPGNSGMSARAMTEFAEKYAATRVQMESHIAEKAGVDGADPHGIKAYIDTIENKAKDKATKALDKASAVEKFLVGHNLDTAGFGTSVADFVAKKLDNQGVIEFVTALVARIETLEAELNKLSLIQFDNVPVGAGIRWWKDTLPEDGTYVWANGQTLYGVNQNFPELVRAWHLSSADNVKVPKEDHTIFKVRKADRKVTAIQHAYIEAANGEVPTTLADVAAAVSSLTGTLATLQEAVANLQGA